MLGSSTPLLDLIVAPATGNDRWRILARGCALVRGLSSGNASQWMSVCVDSGSGVSLVPWDSL
jgi:hypothetical protein